MELPTLQGDIEYIVYDPAQPQIAWRKAHQVLTQLIAQNAGIAIDLRVSGPEPKTTVQEQVSESAPVMLSSPHQQTAIEKCVDNLVKAVKAKDFEEADRAQEEGVRIIQAGDTELEEVEWRSMSLSIRARAGDVRAIIRLRDLSAGNPTHRAPLQALAEIARTFGEHKSAGDLCVKAAETGSANIGLRIQSAKDYRTAKLWDIAARQLELVFKEGALQDPILADALKEMFWLLKDSGDQVAAFCFGEAALQVLPNDSDFRFQLAYAYGDATGGFNERDYRDLALVHYRLLTCRSSGGEYSRNNLGVVYNHFEAPISATEQFRAASAMGNALATANVVRQYLRAGFVDDAKAWVDEHKPSSDANGDVTQALAALHSARDAEEAKIVRVITNEFSHRATLASFATSDFFNAPTIIDGEYLFPIATMKISQEGGAISGTGESRNVVYRLSAIYRSRLWRFEIESKKEGTYFSSSNSRSYGLLKFSANGDSASVLEYHADGEISNYTVARICPRAVEN